MNRGLQGLKVNDKMDYFIKNTLKKSIVYDTYWKFANERQNIFIKKMNGQKNNLTDDEILKKYKFTNVYRSSDRVSQYLIKNVIYNADNLDYTNEDILFRILFFKIFNKIETWQLVKEELGEINYKEFTVKKYSSVLERLYQKKEKIYSGAYIMASGKSFFGYARKYENHLLLLEYMFKDNLMSKINKCKSLKELYELLLKYPTIGSFLAYQYAIDINYSELTDFDEMEFVVAGPGARSGIRKCFSEVGKYSEEDIIKYMAENQENEFERLSLDFTDLWGRKMQLIDCQNVFCETDKYARERHPEIRDKTGRTRIKQLYKSNPEKIEWFYPPKWNLERGGRIE